MIQTLIKCIVEIPYDTIGKIEVRRANLIEVFLIILFILFYFLVWRNGHNISNFFKKLLVKPFSKLSINEKELLTKNTWCNTCGTSEILDCTEEYIKGEYWLVGKCKTCKSTISKKRN